MSEPVFADNRLSMLEDIVNNGGVCHFLQLRVEVDKDNHKILEHRCWFYGQEDRRCESDNCPRLMEAEKADDNNAESYNGAQVIKLEFGDR
ncbi:MAG: hypothetical protein BV459_06705 [Thermoplasmata archaeon M11B2D]|nr:MAG: hypothetical protein BV459_06705 [Thermoplasmata archaeon M11B2D]PNX51207.1 MAG: hypothetical protein BV458_11875 [Thermoplasmata archaeon M9B2D]